MDQFVLLVDRYSRNFIIGCLVVSLFFSYSAHRNFMEVHRHLHEIGCALKVSDRDGVDMCDWIVKEHRHD